MEWYKKSIESTASELSVHIDQGLENQEAEKRLAQYGKNELQGKEKESLIKKIIDQFKDFLVLILIGASIVSIAVGEVTDSIVIIAIVIINAFLGIVQEGKAEKALEALKKMSSPNAKVIRNGHITTVPANVLVPGDIVILEAGDIIPADVRLIESRNLKIEEASLTGESVPSEKDANINFDDDVSIGDRRNMGYMSTTVTYGRGRGIVIGTGTNTEIGKIATVIKEIKDESTPLQQKLDQLGKWLGSACLIICLLVFAIGVIRGQNILEMFMVAISLAVAAIPEGLPAVVTIVLALGMKRMADRNAIVRKLLAVETLGSVTVICSDKTGTLTQNEMTVVKAYAGGEKFEISGQGYNPKGEFSSGGNVMKPESNENFKMLLDAGLLCNDSTLEQRDKDKSWGIIGDPTEGALVVAAAKAGFTKQEYSGKYKRIAEIPFDSDRKMMTTFHTDYMKDKIVSFTKGAPDIILNRCNKYYANGIIEDLTPEIKNQIAEANSGFARQALRVLAFSFRVYDSLPEDINSEAIEKDLVFIGLMGMIDPPRNEAKEAIVKCKHAGIKPVMITGDYKDTAVAIAMELGLMEDGNAVLTGAQLDMMGDDELREKVKETSVYARVSPEHKVRIVDALRRNNQITAMTGDGVNDAMALKRADIGVSMGITGTDVAKGTADMVLMDDNFATIVSAVEEGRIIYSNIRKFVFYLLSCNVGEILIVFLSLLMQLPVPLLPIQLLWLNLVTDSFPALALGTEKGEPDIMQIKPRDSKEPIMNNVMLTGIAVQSIALTLSVLLAFKWALTEYNGDLLIARTIAFTTLILAELIRAYSSRSERYSIIKIGVFSNRIMVIASLVSFLLLLAVIYIPFLQPIFNTYPLSIKDWSEIILYCIIPLLAGEANKLFYRSRSKTA